ncbi:IclR family transcriptional regulator [Williamsia sp. Leaf354]|uniref:daunorubicin/doxorubicin resistance ABC transporter ATP-binding protein DrrA n=1 Tax=Williamsia sp. Leaf354 TaxID=1736349 RepID=UPI000701B726|nr:daunorubicin/doxorubicin resistance ABC transporter ATP-binding protein DrrA [Williamsia sp. Leaf354]KQS00275.1 IclR family transcriptional regulator [Williamsia sp. Leaf354]
MTADPGALDVPAVAVADLVKSYGGVRALDGISFTATRGEVLGLLGPNGSGKTTTVSVLSTLQRPTAGTARICGHDVVDDAARVRELISLTGQYASIDPGLTTTENLTVFGRLTGLRGRRLASRIDELVDQFDLGAVRGRRVGQLSGGMRRRVDIAGALVTRPEVVFLDEPTTGLDPRSRAAVWDTVAGLRDDGITVVLTTQYLEEADRLADRIVMLDRGRVVATGTPGQLKSSVGGAVCEITVADGENAARATALLAGFELIEVDETASAPSSEPGQTRLVVRAPEGVSTVGEVIARLDGRTDDGHGVEVIDIGLRRPSLDEVFLQLTDTPA